MDQPTHPQGDLVGVVLGAGSSTRLGRPKQTLPLGDTTLLGWAVRAAEASCLDRVVVVLGGAADEAEAGMTTRRATIVRNDGYGTGCASSLLAGLDAAVATAAAGADDTTGTTTGDAVATTGGEPSGGEPGGGEPGGGLAGIVMLLGDMPGVDSGIVDAVVAAWRAQPTWAAVTEYDDGLGHPFVFSAQAFATLRTLHGDKAVWKIVDAEPEARVRRIRVHRPVPLDVDTWDDYLAVRRQIQPPSRGPGAGGSTAEPQLHSVT